MWDYWSRIQDYFLNSMNAGVLEALNPVTQIGATFCRKALEAMTRANAVAQVLTAAGFQNWRSSYAFVSSSVMTKFLNGKIVDDRVRIAHLARAAHRSSLSPEKTHCCSATNYTATASSLSGNRLFDHEEDACLHKSFNVNGVTGGTAVSPDSTPSSSPMRRSVLAARSHAPTRWKVLAGDMQRWSPNDSLCVKRPAQLAEKTTAPKRRGRLWRREIASAAIRGASQLETAEFAQ
ncbi:MULTISPECIES: iron-sulfur cluster assembly scaffold protein [Rhizobium]|uniref:Iron-sulfur cluster assembly scaffold protein n=1 Tax=Rhizobium aouanii TaxID=3118145 RepID=A0ABU8CIP6_9HYPH|nr:iron-sulfur cluster assembly scaffold protein [Rhizobium acaciae]MCW1750277.1 iron-sulfur cluster assembly scaffold protein [Rhizobium acaciae]